MLINKLGKHPTHTKLGSLKVLGSDDEENIVKAFLAEIPEAVNIQCFRHFRKTIEHRLWKRKNNGRNEVYTYELFAFN